MIGQSGIAFIQGLNEKIYASFNCHTYVKCTKCNLNDKETFFANKLKTYCIHFND